ncbi:HptB-dependent secretion and biofilm anti anti-sigma factor [Azospirillaceae bacterium]
MDYIIDESNDSITVRLLGRFTYSDHSKFRNVIDKVKNSSFKNCIFDLSRLEFIDSTGLGMMVLANDVCERNGFTLRLINAQGRVRTVLERVEFSTIMTIN